MVMMYGFFDEITSSSYGPLQIRCERLRMIAVSELAREQASWSPF